MSHRPGPRPPAPRPLHALRPRTGAPPSRTCYSHLVDHAALLPGPPLDRWLARALRPHPRVGLWSAAGGGEGIVGAGARAALRGLDLVALDGSDGRDLAVLDALVVLTPLGDDAAAPHLDRLRPGGLLVELAHPPRWRLGELLWPWPRRARQRWAVERRARAWALAGLHDLRQWAPLEPGGIVVTEGRRRAIPGP